VHGAEKGLGAAVTKDRALDVEGDHVGGAFPDRAEIAVAKQARVHPFLDIAVAAADVHGLARHHARAGGEPALGDRVENPVEWAVVRRAGAGSI